MSASGNISLEQHDPEMFNLIEAEKNRQWKCLELIASENFTSRAVMDCLGSCLTNKYAEGIPSARYYGGNEVIDKIETLCQTRALKAYGLNPEEWGVNVQPYSGSPANFAVYTALLRPHDRIMGLDLPSGGHLTHGFYTYSKAENTRKAVSATSVYFESLPYRVHPETGLVDFEKLAETAALFKPAMIVCGGSAYPRDWDYAAFRKIADDNGSLLMCDMAHYSGLVAAQEHASPFEFCDVVTTTTHKSLRGPRAGMIFFRKDTRGFENKINQAVFPALQGGPHEHQIAAIATQLKEVMTPEFKAYAKQVKSNCRAIAAALVEYGYVLSTGGTDNHLLLWDLRPVGITGSKMEKLCDEVCITLNKNSVLGDRSAVTPGGVRVGTPALTSRGFKEADFVTVAGFLHRAVQLCLEIQATTGKKIVDFNKALESHAGVKALRADVNAFATKFNMPGFDVASMRNKTI
ncbi:serine hydroxymethyltransferase 2 [Saprolegnia parasitica CBS 223.65]|uniref:Serine hydroxymethyltransferase n=1 Tax=Saprolegnia parasitica (strain CBS 223.65) TaxID=695850 RepID=A0A067CD48_SAPPC|nr:serine hydroxymethyltransferase 2 [Saprolegnia parasitica CBS 223.65]KDO24481.1 serine hydroxymethyltransferase 2 [Saprolegnia parasitica CBS 223.65]|eukprot:XP_012204747.1 serine hydroxymethyltransferase 2 [Saprolegnia parasitica CBS 223.65]